MESQEDFDQRKSIYIQQKTILVDRLKYLVDEQNKVLDEIAALRKPTLKPPVDYYYLSCESQEHIRRILEGTEEGDCDYEIDHSKFTHVPGWTPGRVVLKTDTKWTKSIEHLLFDGREILDNEQSYLINRIIRPDYKTKEEIEQAKKRKFNRLDSDEESW